MIIEMAGEKYEVQYTEDPRPIMLELDRDLPKYITFDTETTGLHIKKDRPFLGAVAWDGKVFIFPTIKEILDQLVRWAKKVKRVYAHNTSYDMHMGANICGDNWPLLIENWGDSMGLCRLAFESISARDGGDSLALKRVSKKYIDPTADRYEKEVKSWLKAKEAADRKILIALLHGIKDEGGKWSMKRLTTALNEGVVPAEVTEVFEAWKQEYPKPTYQDVPLEIIIPYLAVDVILTNILVRKALPIVVHKEQVEVMNREFDLIPVVWKMERAGIAVDREYLQESNKKLEDYIQDLTIQMHTLAGMDFSVGQHAKIKKIYTDLLGEEPESTDKQFLKKMQKSEDEIGAELAKIISKLRRLEKWKQTYIERILDASAYDGRLYTQMSQFNPISGRFSGDMQQQPKESIYDEEGNELFTPRRAFVVTGNGWNSMYFLDLSQIELRLQAHYTLHFGGDVNLCRAYFPFKCIHYKDGSEFNFRTEEGRKRWDEMQECGEKSAWLIPETKEPWIETDVHSATTIKALLIMGINPDEISKEEFKMWRYKGKMTNFLRNYGGSAKACADQLDIHIDEATALTNGYTEAFPVVVTYQENIVKAMTIKGYVQNLYGRRYYIDNPKRYYKTANYIIQGTAADDFKNKMLEIDKFLVKNNCKSRQILCVHDENIFEIYEGEEYIVPKIKEIMETAPNILVPVVSDVEVTKTTWADKKGVAV